MKKYQIILADPPWSYWLGGKKNASRHYNCMSIEDIYNLPINKMAGRWKKSLKELYETKATKKA